MELWIRSQNKGGLIKVEILGNTDGTIHSYSGNNKIKLGEYSSDERALEVLDEIQKLLKPTFNIYEPKEYDKPRVCTDLTPSIKVYEMPKE